jgi:hypothetical protein
MASPEIWLEVLAWTKTLFEATTATIDLAATYRKHRQERDTIQEAARVSVVFSTYTEGEVQALSTRLQGCRDRFIKQGSGADRANCICSVLNEAAAGNGGTLPLIDDWQNIYSTLRCARSRR